MTEYIYISGVINNLCKSKIYEDLAQNKGKKSLTGTTSIAAAIMGDSTSSTILASTTRGAEIDMEYFTCFVGETKIHGRFHRIGFTDGDSIDFIIRLNNGIGKVYSARNPIERVIWTLPYQTRGHVAQKINDILSSFIVSLTGGLLIGCFSLYQESRPLKECWEIVFQLSLMAFFMTLVVNVLVRRPFFHLAVEATKIFELYGFKEPARLDFPKQHRSADKEYYKEVGKDRPWEEIPWQYRYSPRLMKN